MTKLISTYIGLYCLIALSSCACPCHKSGPEPVLRFDGPIDSSYLEEPACAYDKVSFGSP